MSHLTFLRFDKPQNQVFLSSRPNVFNMSSCTYNESSVKAAFEEFNINLLSCQEKVYTDQRCVCVCVCLSVCFGGGERQFSSKLESFLSIVKILNKMSK